MNAEPGVEFCDTNVLVYAYDATAGEKRQIAKDLLVRLWDAHRGAISVQVLQEFYVTLTRKVAQPLTPAAGREIVSDLASWRIAEPERKDVLDAIDASVRWGVSFWDAMILVAAAKCGASIVWSEDLADGQTYGEVVVRNPFGVQREEA